MTDAERRLKVDDLLSNSSSAELYAAIASEVDAIQLGAELAKGSPLPYALRSIGHAPDWERLKIYLKDGGAVANYQKVLALCWAYLITDSVTSPQESAFYAMLMILFKSLVASSPASKIIPASTTTVAQFRIAGTVPNVPGPFMPPLGALVITGTVPVITIG